MALSDMTDLATWPPFVRRVTGAMMKAAVAVGNEEYDGTQYRIMRRALATKALEDTMLWGARFAYAVAANVAVTHDSNDGDIEFTVNSTWDAMAGAYVPAEEPE
jgi:hypothetical protein